MKYKLKKNSRSTKIKTYWKQYVWHVSISEATISLLDEQVCPSFLLSAEMYAGRLACYPSVSHVEYAPRALLK